jgi:hypothetical protein
MLSRGTGGFMRLQLISAVILGVALLLPGSAVAQERGSADEARSQLEQSGATSSSEKISFARKAVAEMQDGERKMSKALEQAEKEKDPIKIQCVTKKLSSTRALLEVSLSAQARMKEAIDAGANEKGDHEFRKIAVALAKERQFLAEAEACMGGGGKDAGQTQVEVVGASEDRFDVTDPLTGLGDDVGLDPPNTSPFD